MTALPLGWELIRLEDLCEPGKQAIVDGPFGSNLKRSDYVESGIPVLKIQNIKENLITLKKMDYVKPEKYEELARHSYTEGDIVMTKLGDPLGVSAIVNGIPDGLIVADLVRIRPSKVLTKFLCYQLNSPRIQKYINEQQKGTTRPRVNLAMIRELPIYIPSLSKQHRIVELLEDHLSRLDTALDDVKQAKIKAAQFRRSLLHSIFDGQVEEFGNKNEWDNFILSDVVQNLDNKRIPVNSKERSTRQGSVPYYGATGQVGTIDLPIFNEDLLLLGEDGVQFFDPSKPKAYLISGPAWVNNHVHVLKARDSIANQKLLMHYLNQFNYVGYANGTTRLKLTQGAMNLIPISLPNRRIQEKMLEYIELKLSIVDASVISADYVAAQGLSLRRALLQSAFTGQLTKEVAVV